MVTLRFVSYSDIDTLSSVGRIRKLLNIAKEDKIVVLQGKLKKEEEKELIKATMEEINSEFKGIELAVVDSNESGSSGFAKLKQGFINKVLGDRQGLTIIGPASIVKEIKKDPTKIELLTKDNNPNPVNNPNKSRKKRR
jgi:hypothetical protein